MSANSKASPHVNGDGFDPGAVLSPSRALSPVVTRLNERIVHGGFWPKLKRAAAKIPFAADALAVWYCARDDETPASAKAMIMAALAYFILPVDAIPDFLPAIGYTDDAAVIAAVLAIVARNLKPWHRAAAKAALERLAGEG
ncbi:YkvA family protein [Caulobacter sp. KR2-114]|uniref:YkvA family protein n=1 Tax=Caulobacter sp. KR2-114 TaxID=3400912 RepID=UPI003C0365B3